MKTKLFSSIVVLLLTLVIWTGIGTTTNASNTHLKELEEEKMAQITRTIGKGASGYLPAKGTLTLYPTLTTSKVKMYFWFWATALGDSTPSGKITYRLYDPSGNYMFKRTVSVGVNKIDVYPSPKTGMYRVEITSGVSEKVFINCTWSLQRKCLIVGNKI